MGRFFEAVWVIAACSACLGIAVIGLGCGGESTGERAGLRFEGTEPGDCSDDADNDADGLFDCDDSGCSGASVCSDGGVSGAGGFGGMMGSGGMAGGGGTSGTGGVGGAAGAGGTGGIGGVGGSGGPPFGGGGTGGTGGTMQDCSSLTNPPEDCDKSCNSDSECTASFCENNTKCVAHCTADEGCGTTATCDTRRGRCIPNMGNGGTGGGGNTNGCQSVTITPSRSIPNVMFLVDQSGSMTDNFSGKERWTAAHDAIVAVTGQLDSIVRFGLTTYTSDDGDFNPTCPRLPVAGNPLAGAPRVDFGLNNSGVISDTAVYPSSYPSDAGADTPTGDSIDALVTIIENDPPPMDGPTIIVLATDGLPDSCECPDSGNCVPGTPGSHDPEVEAVDAAENAFSNGVQTFILSVGPDVAQSHLQQVANVGVGLNRNGSEGNAPFYTANTPAELDMAFQEIIGDSISCDIQINKPFDDKEKACNDPESDVQLNGTPLSCPSEWRVKPGADDIIELVGSACATFQSGAATFTAVFPCGAIVVE